MFPVSIGGKAYDTGLVLSWLEDEMGRPKAMAVNKLA